MTSATASRAVCTIEPATDDRYDQPYRFGKPLSSLSAACTASGAATAANNRRETAERLSRLEGVSAWASPNMARPASAASARSSGVADIGL